MNTFTNLIPLLVGQEIDDNLTITEAIESGEDLTVYTNHYGTTIYEGTVDTTDEGAAVEEISDILIEVNSEMKNSDYFPVDDEGCYEDD